MSRHFCKKWCVIWKFNWHSFEPLYISSWMILKWFLIFGPISYKWPLIAKGLILAVPTYIWKWIYNNLSLNFFTSIWFISCKNSFLHNFQKDRCTQRLLRPNTIYVVILDLRSFKAWPQWILKLHIWIVGHLKGHMWLQIWPIWNLW